MESIFMLKKEVSDGGRIVDDEFAQGLGKGFDHHVFAIVKQNARTKFPLPLGEG